MACFNCNQPTRESVVGDWCDSCGGLVARKGLLLLRHVATLKNDSKMLLLVHDSSTSDYSFAVKRPIKYFVERKGEWVQELRTFTYHGNLGEVLTLAIAELGPEAPELVVAKTATPEEAAELAL